jgi:HK97 family phage portal protein
MKFSRRVELAAKNVRNFFIEKAMPFVFPAWGMGGMGVPSLIDYETYAQEGYGQNAIVHSCVREISRSAPSARLQVQKRLKNSQSEVWEEHPLQAVLDRPNPHQSQSEFVEMLYTYLNIDGNAFIIRERKGTRTTAMWLPRPDRMRPVIEGRGLVGYVYVTMDGERIPFLVEDVIHIKEPNPADPYEGLGRGMAPLSAAAVETDVDNRATKFMKMFFDNAAVPFGLLKSKNILSDPEVKRIRARMKEQFSGERNWHELLVLDADADYQRMGLNLEEMAFVDLRAISETRICSVFKVPPILIGIKAGLDASTYSNYTQARRAMWEDKIIPDNNKLSDKLTAAMGDELGPDGRIGHDYSQVVALQEDRNSRFARANQGVNGGWITVNEARREVGLGPVRGGDVFLRPLMATERSQSGEDGKRLNHKGHEGHEGRHEEEGKKGEEGREELGARVWKMRDRVSRAWEMRYAKAAVERFGVEQREVEAAIRSQKRLNHKGHEGHEGRTQREETGEDRKEIAWGNVERAIFGVIDGESEREWMVRFLPLFRGLLEDQAEEEAEQLGIDWNFENPAVRAFLEQYSLTFAQRIGTTTKLALQQVLIQAREEDWQITRLITEVGRLYEGWKDFQRSEMIARSETIRASNAGAEQAYLLAGIEREEWFTSEDERVCEFCGEMHGKTVRVNEVFFRQGETMSVVDQDGKTQQLKMDYEDVGYPPLHPDCRCTILPVVE